jgi:lipoyl(octanoyl) transferase
MQILTSPAPIPYPEAIAIMEQRVEDVIAGRAEELIWFLEHPAIITAGTSARESDIIDTTVQIINTGRGGKHTYHGPGQRVVYLILDLKKRAHPNPPDLRAYVKSLENCIITSLAEFGVEAFTRDGRVGVWVNQNSQEKKIAAIGVRVKKWVTSHGFSINLNPNLADYSSIVPCGIQGYGVTSLHEMGLSITMQQLDASLLNKLPYNGY